ncbi:hypothetical protein PsorP6_001369 [Peronosclerospora sorghi]|uniref:Uncharacterized protein n=1 Tax=Peronosclerospora sorghi TaxID=230839 RepID=A0ACC0WSA4_9STRA|nr:hypothetical protein PsorP6_001369 [Peronosclerospora sorghi]
MAHPDWHTHVKGTAIILGTGHLPHHYFTKIPYYDLNLIQRTQKYYGRFSYRRLGCNMGCILTKVCLDEASFCHHRNHLRHMTPSDRLDHELTLLPSRRLSRVKTTLLVDESNEVSKTAELSINEDESETQEATSNLVVYGGGIPGVALDANQVERPEFTGARDGGYKSVNGRLRWGSRTRAGNDPLRRRKENQDAFFVCDMLAQDSNATFFSVFDGHGPQGAFVSHFVREQYHRAVAEAYSKLLSRASSEKEAGNLTSKSVTRNVTEEIFQQATRTVVNKLNASVIDISVSGTTAVAMLVREEDVYIANLGDSRAVVARYSKESQRYVLHCETKDHKPDVPEERARIEQKNGRVFEWGSYRVWLQDVDIPGLAMSRSFGDSVAKTVGVTAEPDVTVVEKLDFSTSRKNGDHPAAFAVLASDGIWEFMTTSECIDFVAKCILDSGKLPQEACNALIDEACDRWDAEEDVVDDITAVVIYF